MVESIKVRTGRIFWYFVVALIITIILGAFGFLYLFDDNATFSQALLDAITTMTTLALPKLGNTENNLQRLFIGSYAFIATLIFYAIVSYIIIELAKDYTITTKP